MLITLAKALLRAVFWVALPDNREESLEAFRKAMEEAEKTDWHDQGLGGT